MNCKLQIITKISKDHSKQHLIPNFELCICFYNDDFSIYTKLTLHKTYTSNEHCPFLALDIYILHWNRNMYEERDEFLFPIVTCVNYPFNL